MTLHGKINLLVVFLALSSLSKCMLPESVSDIAGNTLNQKDTNDEVDFFLRSFKRLLPSQVKLGNFDNDSVSNCSLSGLNTGLTRHGDAILDVTDDKATFNFGLSIKDIILLCNWKYKLGLIKFDGVVKAFTDRVSARVRLSIDLTPEARPKLEEFDVTELGKINTDLSGLGIFNWLGERILNGKIKDSREKIMKELEHNVAMKLQSKLDSLKLGKR